MSWGLQSTFHMRFSKGDGDKIAVRGSTETWGSFIFVFLIVSLAFNGWAATAAL